jgi:tRNA-dihydrouridine synthase
VHSRDGVVQAGLEVISLLRALGLGQVGDRGSDLPRSATERDAHAADATIVALAVGRVVVVVQLRIDAGQMLAEALLIQRHVDGVDIKLGCPQACACKGGYGAFLMDHPDRVRGIVETLVAGLDVPVTAKIRVFPEVH